MTPKCDHGLFRRPPSVKSPAVDARCEVMAEVRVRERDADVPGSWEAVLRFFRLRSSLLMARPEEVLW